MSHDIKILITGSNGLLGQKLVAECQHRGLQFLATSRGDNRIEYSTFKYQSLDITSHQEVRRIMEEYRPTTLINSAAMTQVDLCEEDKESCWNLNVVGVKNLRVACEEIGTHFIHLSTDFIFDGRRGPYLENAEPNPLSYYGESKLAAEKVVMSGIMPWTIIRTILVYGKTPGMSRSNLVLWVKKSLEDGSEISVVDDQYRTPTLAEDLAIGCLLTAVKRATGIFNISGKEMLTPYDMAQLTAEFFSLNKKLIKRTNSRMFKQAARRPMKTGFIINKARRELGYEPHSFDQGLKILASQLDK